MNSMRSVPSTSSMTSLTSNTSSIQSQNQPISTTLGTTVNEKSKEEEEEYAAKKEKLARRRKQKRSVNMDVIIASKQAVIAENKGEEGDREGKYNYKYNRERK